MNLALRFDHFKASFPEQTVGPAELAPTRNFVFPAQDNLNWNDLTYRTGLIYDVARERQDGRQADVQQVPARADAQQPRHRPEPGQHDGHHGEPRVDRLRTRTSCPTAMLLNLAANGECLGISNPLFGSAARSATFDDILRTGYGNREANWEFSAGVQHEAGAPRLG